MNFLSIVSEAFDNQWETSQLTVKSVDELPPSFRLAVSRYLGREIKGDLKAKGDLKDRSFRQVIQTMYENLRPLATSLGLGYAVSPPEKFIQQTKAYTSYQGVLIKYCQSLGLAKLLTSTPPKGMEAEYLEAVYKIGAEEAKKAEREVEVCNRGTFAISEAQDVILEAFLLGVASNIEDMMSVNFYQWKLSGAEEERLDALVEKLGLSSVIVIETVSL